MAAQVIESPIPHTVYSDGVVNAFMMEFKKMKRLLAVAIIPLFLAACGGDGNPGTDDGMPDVVGQDIPATDTPIVDVPPEDNGTDSGTELPSDNGGGDADATTEPYENGATALVAAQADLIGGPNATAVPGDILIRNKHVRFVIRNQEHSLYSPYGGAIVDADIAREPGDEGHEKFHELFPMTGFARIFNPNQMEIVDDGTYSGTAIVRFKGTDGGMALVDSVLPTFALGLDVTTDYILGPDDNFVEIRTTIKDPNNSGMTFDVGQFLQFGNRATTFFDRCGVDPDCLAGKKNVRWLASAAGDVSYALTVPGTDFVSLLLAQSELLILASGQFEIPKNGEIVTRSFLIVDKGTIDDVARTARRIRGEAEGIEVTINVTLSDTFSDMKDVFIKAKVAEESNSVGWRSATAPDAEGKAVISLEPGVYDITVSLPGAPDALLDDVTVSADGLNEFDVTMAAAGRVHVAVTDGDDQSINAAITFQNGADAPWTNGVARYEAVHNGDRTFPILPGTYTATIGRGLAYTIDRKNVTVTAGEITDIVGSIDAAYDVSGFVMMNSHEHSEHSIDSAVLVEDRVWNALANGIQVMNPTDHDFFGTRMDTIQNLDVQELVTSAHSCEVSPIWGHTTAADCSNPPPYPTYFAVNYTLYNESGAAERAMTATEIYNQVRNELQCNFLAINHPYRGGPTFETYGIGADTDPKIALPDLDITLVDALEVINKDDSLDSILNENLPAWFNLLNRGYVVAGIGGSDEHHYRGNYGNPRNAVMLDATDMSQVDVSDVFNNVKGFKNLVMSGPMVRLTVDGYGMGDVVTMAGETVEVHLLIEAPEWMGLNFCKVFMNGELIREFTPVVDGAVLRLDETFTVTPESDAWIVAYAGSNLPEHEMTPVADKQPLSITNPVFIDADGNGYEAIYKNGAPWDAE